MELLNNIWNVLSTPNECLINILSIPFTILEAILTMLLFLVILNIYPTFKQKILYTSSISIISLIVTYMLPAPFNLIINYFSTKVNKMIDFSTKVNKIKV